MSDGTQSTAPDTSGAVDSTQPTVLDVSLDDLSKAYTSSVDLGWGGGFSRRQVLSWSNCKVPILPTRYTAR